MLFHLTVRYEAAIIFHHAAAETMSDFMTNDRLPRAPISKGYPYTDNRLGKSGLGAMREESRASLSSGQGSRGHRGAARNHYVTGDPYEPVDALP